MSDITNVLEQNAIADSLLSGPPSHVMANSAETGELSLMTLEDAGLEAIEQTWQPGATEPEYRLPDAEQGESQEFEFLKHHKPGDYEPEYDQREPLEQLKDFVAEQAKPEQQAEAKPEQGLSIQQVIEQNKLNDPQEAESLASEFLSAFGAGQLTEQMQPVQFQNTLTRTGLSLAQLYDSTGGNAERLPNYDFAAIGQDWGREFLSSFNVDHRTVDFDAAKVGDVVMNAAWNVLSTFDAMGRNADVTKLNSPESAMTFYAEFMSAFGHQGPVDRAEAVKVADVFARGILAPLVKLGKAGQAKQAPSAPQARKGRTAQAFKTNTDIFDSEVMQRLASERL